MTPSSIDIIRAETILSPVPFVPEIVLHQGTAAAAKTWQSRTDIPTPFWAFPWPGGQALARYILDNPECVHGKRVLDFASGSGLAGLAAAKAGAAKVWACDSDPLAQAATELNASCNNVAVRNIPAMRMDQPATGVDLILAGDVCYDQAVAARILRWLYLCIGAGTSVLLGDPGRAYVPEKGLRELVRYVIPVRRELEDSDARAAYVWELFLP
ncbi:MAG: 50S ribosomal protein L11 methyltransferase [Alphaproteobacteria bacterium]|nr:50S ribosomal protein L11 methyltransferase [Alphaproteobacteria bacterium]